MVSGKELACNAGGAGDMGLIPMVGEIPWRRAWQPTPVFLPGEVHGQRSLEGYCLQVAKSQTQLRQLSSCKSLSRMGSGENQKWTLNIKSLRSFVIKESIAMR